MSDTTRTDAPPPALDLGDDLGWALGVLLRGYRDRVKRALGDFPHGPRGYETMAEVLRGTQPSQLARGEQIVDDQIAVRGEASPLRRRGTTTTRGPDRGHGHRVAS